MVSATHKNLTARHTHTSYIYIYTHTPAHIICTKVDIDTVLIPTKTSVVGMEGRICISRHYAVEHPNIISLTHKTDKHNVSNIFFHHYTIARSTHAQLIISCARTFK